MLDTGYYSLFLALNKLSSSKQYPVSGNQHPEKGDHFYV